MLLTPVPASALPPLAGDKDADGVSDQDEINISITPTRTTATRTVTASTTATRSTTKSRIRQAPTPMGMGFRTLTSTTRGTRCCTSATPIKTVSPTQEVDEGTKPLDHASHPGAATDQGPKQGQNRPDTDQDGLFDEDEINVYGTNPTKADTDGDGRDDGQEVFDKTDPNNRFD